MKYECECIKNTEKVKLYENCINSKQTNSLTSMLPMMFNWIEKNNEIYDL